MTEVKSEEIDTSAQDKKRPKRAKPTRYFDSSIDHIPLEEDSSSQPPRPNEEVIQVSMQEKPLRYKNRQQKKKPFRYVKPKIDKDALARHSRGEKAEESGVKTKYFKEKLKRKEVYYEYANEQAARTELLLKEQPGFIVAENEEERTVDLKQEDIVKNVDITAATKHFKLNLDFGPYRLRYSNNGRHLLLGGKMGHVALFDWVTKRLFCEMNVMEEVADVSFLHNLTMFACAQKKWVHIYDKKGTELHCVKKLYNINRMEFLPYHFLLSTGSSEGYLSWLDVSIGEIVGHYNTKQGDIRIMRQNPTNGVICLGGGKGVVSMWSPKVRQPLAKLLCHGAPMTALAIDTKGTHLVTAALDRKIKIWDVREMSGPLAIYTLSTAANELEISQRGVLAYSMGNICGMYSKILLEENAHPYLRHRIGDFIHGMRFCPFEDILGVSTDKGFTSLLVPGSGEPNFDALEANPFQTNSQRRENEVHSLLEKIPAELITLDPNDIAGVDVETLQQKIENKKKILFVKPPQIDFKPRRKMKGRGGSVKAARNKQIVKDTARKEFIREIQKQKKELIEEFKVENEEKTAEDFIPLETKTETSILDIFKPKKRKLK